MAELLVIVSLGGRQVALLAAEVQSVIELDSVSAIPCTPPHVAGLAALRSKVLTVIDCRRSLEIDSATNDTGNRTAAVVEFEGHPYALLVDAVNDVVEARSECIPLSVILGNGWDRAARGTVETDNGPLLLLEVQGLVAGPPATPNAKAA